MRTTLFFWPGNLLSLFNGRTWWVVALPLLLAVPAKAETIAEFHERHKAEIEMVRKNGNQVEVVYKSGASRPAIDAVEQDKAATTFTDKPVEDATKKEIDAAIKAKAADPNVTDDEYAKLLRLQNIQDKAKRDAEWEAQKNLLDAKDR